MIAASPTRPPELPGYRLTDLLGSGGCGEVWRAEAPGGIAKAVKCVFGQYNEKRAATELRALERIKSVRHPFLLSLDRIEVVEGRLIVVTELADGSLRDRFEACQAAGLPGIERSELLRYMAEAADALDFLTDQHDLQHLDIKPENLLLVAGHIKVADFGLVKQVASTQASMVGGLTPTYAAPEVFQGAPSRQSDQYSLAVLYQELLTGSPPFPGINVAELTWQHLHDEPDLSRLNENDRFVISQALAKDPAHRFATCRAMVAALLAQPVTSTTEPGEISAGRQASVRMRQATEMFDDLEAQRDVPISIELPKIDPPRVAKPRTAPHQFAVTPTLIIGIGSTGEQALRGYRRRVARIAGVSALDAAQRMMLIDCDPRTIAKGVRPDPQVRGLRSEETLATPLHHPSDYRDKADALLGWLSRRWLYNIPKSLRTEGLRPLGRLALIDQSRQVVQRIRIALSDLLQPDQLDAAEQQLGRPVCRDAVHVRLVGSISGGTASGMLLDLAYAVRTLLARMPVVQSRVTAVVAHSTGNDAQRSELARVNSFAWLTEYLHLAASAHPYPGDAGAGFPAHDAVVRPFDQLHLIDLGRGLDDSTFAQNAGVIGDFLAVSTLLPVSDCLATTPPSTLHEAPRPATFSLVEVPLADESRRQQLAAPIQSFLRSTWLPTDEPTKIASDASASETHSTGHLVPGVTQWIVTNRLDLAGLQVQVQNIVARHLGDEGPLALLRRRLEQRGISRDRMTFAAGAEVVNQMLADDEPDQQAATRTTLSAAIERVAAELARSANVWLTERLEDPVQRLPGCLRALEWLEQHLTSIHDQLTALHRDVTSRVVACNQSATTKPTAEPTELVVGFLRLRVEQFLLEQTLRLVASLQAHLQPVAERWQRVRTVLRKAFGSMDKLTASAAECDGEQLATARALSEQVNERLAPQDHSQTLVDWLLLGAGEVELPAAIRQAIDDVLREHFTRQLAQHATPGGTYHCPEPILNAHGGTLRYVLIAPPGVAADSLVGPQEAQNVATVELPHADAALLVTEIADLSSTHVAATLVNHRRDYAEYASRAYSRRDIDWESLLDKMQGNDAATPVFPNWDFAASAATTS